MTNSKMIQQFRTAVAVGTPLIAVRCLDNESVIAEIQKLLNGDSGTAVIQWDVVRGWKARNEEGKLAIAQALAAVGQEIEVTQSPVEQADIALNLPQNTFLFLINAHRYLTSDYPNAASFVQAICNLRDPFKSSQRTCILLGPDFTLPAELQQDVLVLDQPLPTAEELKDVVVSLVKERKAKVEDGSIDKAVDALRGLASFPSEQTTAMSLIKGELDHKIIWDRKCQVVKETEGLSIWQDGLHFAELGGLEAIQGRSRRIIQGRKPFRVVCWIDEGEKQTAGAGPLGDSSGTSQDQISVLLSEMEDKHYNGMLLVGVPGGGKSAFCKALGTEAGVPTIRMDLGAFKGSLVGESERKVRQAMKVVEAVGGEGGAFFVMTCNDIRSIRPEMKRRFRKGIWFFDLPTHEERDAIWSIYLKKFPEVDKSYRERVNDNNWTGAEIETCVTTAWEEDINLVEASRSIIPVAVSGIEDVERLRREAAGRYNSASYEGPYTLVNNSSLPSTSIRKFNIN